MKVGGETGVKKGKHRCTRCNKARLYTSACFIVVAATLFRIQRACVHVLALGDAALVRSRSAIAR